jgi:hypothetical protein
MPRLPIRQSETILLQPKRNDAPQDLRRGQSIEAIAQNRAATIYLSILQVVFLYEVWREEHMIS